MLLSQCGVAETGRKEDFNQREDVFSQTVELKFTSGQQRNTSSP